MRPGFLNTCLMSVYFLIASATPPHELSDVKGSQEPTCDQLRAMWRFSKRQSRAAESTNEIPTYRDPFAYNMWEEPATLRSGAKRPLVYGRMVNQYQRRLTGSSHLPERVRAFEEVARLFGTAPHTGKLHGRRKPMPMAMRLVGGNYGLHSGLAQGGFQHLKAIIQTERARELREQKGSEENMLDMISEAENPFAQLAYKPFARSRSQGQMVNLSNVLAPTGLFYLQRTYPDRLTMFLPPPNPAARGTFPLCPPPHTHSSSPGQDYTVVVSGLLSTIRRAGQQTGDCVAVLIEDSNHPPTTSSFISASEGPHST